MKILEVSNLEKYYDNYKVVNQLSFDIRNGEAVILKGRNGIGKSTILKCLIGSLVVDKGEILICGKKHTDSRAKNYIGYSPDKSILFPYLSAKEHFKLWCSLRGLGKDYLDKSIELLSTLDFNEKQMNDISKTYSNGMQQKVSFIGSIFHSPKIVILDEPFTAMDVASTAKALTILQDLKLRDTSILFTSHQEEIEHQLADREIKLE